MFSSSSFQLHKSFAFFLLLCPIWQSFHKDSQRTQTPDFQFSSVYIDCQEPSIGTLYKARDASPPFFSFQNTFLQETVRRECEERFELTEALSQAREQLLELRRLSGSLPVTPRFLSRGSLAASAAGHQGERSLAKPNSEKGTKTPGLHIVPKPTPSPTSAQPKRANSSGLPSLLQPHPPRGQASSVKETRQRLAALLRRRLNQR